LVGNLFGECRFTIIGEPVAELGTVAWIPVTVVKAGTFIVVAVSLSAIPVGASVIFVEVVVEVPVA